MQLVRGNAFLLEIDKVHRLEHCVQRHPRVLKHRA